MSAELPVISSISSSLLCLEEAPRERCPRCVASSARPMAETRLANGRTIRAPRDAPATRQRESKGGESKIRVNPESSVSHHPQALPMSLDNVTPGKNVPDAFNVVIEIPMNADPVKYEVDKETGAIFVDRFMSTS